MRNRSPSPAATLASCTWWSERPRTSRLGTGRPIWANWASARRRTSGGTTATQPRPGAAPAAAPRPPRPPAPLPRAQGPRPLASEPSAGISSLRASNVPRSIIALAPARINHEAGGETPYPQHSTNYRLGVWPQIVGGWCQGNQLATTRGFLLRHPCAKPILSEGRFAWALARFCAPWVSNAGEKEKNAVKKGRQPQAFFSFSLGK